MNETGIKYVATFHGLNGLGNSIQIYPSLDGLTDADAIELATSYAKTMAPFLPEGAVNVVVDKIDTKMKEIANLTITSGTKKGDNL